MSIKILTKNSIDNTNIDGARQNHFSAGMKSGIVKGSLNEGRFFASASNIIALDTCVLLISGHQVVIDSVQYITLSNKPITPTRYSMIAEISVNDNSEPTFRLFIQASETALIQQNLFNTQNGAGTYQINIGNFTLDTNGEIQEINRIVDVISGGGDGASVDIEFNASAETISSDLQPEVNVDYNEETKKYDMLIKIPSGTGSKVLVGGVVQDEWDADIVNENTNKIEQLEIINITNAPTLTFAESERQKSKNLFDGNFVQGAYSFGDGSIVVLDSYIRSKDLIDVKPNENIVLSWVGTTPNDECGFIFFNNGQYVSSTRGTNAVVPANANQVGININQSPSINIDSVSNCQLEYNTVTTDFQQYNGAIVHEKDLNKIVTLWENPSPDEAFLPQSITLANDNYDYLLILYRTNGADRQSTILSKKEIVLNSSIRISSEHKESNGSIWQMAFLSRGFHFSSYININFYNCEKTIHGDGNSTASNENMKPIEIIGIKVGA